MSTVIEKNKKIYLKESVLFFFKITTDLKTHMEEQRSKNSQGILEEQS